MKNPSIKIKEHTFVLSPFKTIYWQNKDTLLISDIHFGKETNSELVFADDINKFKNTIEEFNPKRIIILGDLFDAKSNLDTDIFKSFLKKLKKEVILILGNHDKLGIETYKNLGINEVLGELKEDMFLFTHKPIKSTILNVHGHLHIAVNFKNIKLACFTFEDKSICLPAFGGVTGKNTIFPNSFNKVYVIANNEVKKII